MADGCPPCPLCGLRDIPMTLQEAELQLAGSPVLRREPCVDGETYLARIRICLECDQLLGGVACRQCGCMIPLRARLTRPGCPHPGGSRWNNLMK